MSAGTEAIRGEEAVKAALIEAAANLLAEVGPSSLSVRDLARRAGVNHGQVHHYFGSKRSLLEAAMRSLARDHFENTTQRAGGGVIPPALSLADDPRYWRAVCQVVMEGDMELARIEVDEDISIPRRALDWLLEQRSDADDEFEIRARFAAMAALQLGWVALERFVFLIADIPDDQQNAIRDRVKQLIGEMIDPDGTTEALAMTGKPEST